MEKLVLVVNDTQKTKANTMTSLEIAELTNKTHANVMRDIRSMFDKLGVSDELKIDFADNINNLGFSVKSKFYNLSRRECEILITGYDVVRRAAVIDRWFELETKQQQVALPTTYLEALEKLLETEKEKIAISYERDEAIKTKAHISDKKTATAMNTASRLSKENKLLQSKLQDVGTYQSIIAAQLPERIETELNPKAQTWRVLLKFCKEMNLPPKKVKDSRFGEVNTYHVDVINRVIDCYL